MIVKADMMEGGQQIGEMTVYAADEKEAMGKLHELALATSPLATRAKRTIFPYGPSGSAAWRLRKRPEPTN